MEWRDGVEACGLTFILGWAFGYVFGRTHQEEVDIKPVKGMLKRVMRFFIFLLVVCLLPACASTVPGIRTYAPITVTDKNGHTSQKMAKTAEISVDAPGAASIDVGAVHMKFYNQILTAQTPTYDSKGNVTGYSTSQYSNGLYVSHVVDAQGNAVYKCINAGAAGASGIMAWIFGAVTTGGIAGALH